MPLYHSIIYVAPLVESIRFAVAQKLCGAFLFTADSVNDLGS